MIDLPTLADERASLFYSVNLTKNNMASVQVLDLTESSQRQRQDQETLLRDLEAKKIAPTIDVPTLPDQVREALRGLGLPVRFFGENLAQVRDRLRYELAKRQVYQDGGAVAEQQAAVKQQEEEQVTKYTRASQALMEARRAIASFSLRRAQERLERERRWRTAAVRSQNKGSADDSLDHKPAAQDDELLAMDKACRKTYQRIRNMALEGSQYGDSRALSCVCAAILGGSHLVVTASWTASINLWNAEDSTALPNVGIKTQCHEDRIMGMALQKLNETSCLVATASLDRTAKLWRIQQTDVVMKDSGMDDNASSVAYSIAEQQVLKGHVARLCRVAFHPMQRHVATTSCDHSWRLWDIETSECLLLQDGHAREVYGIGFHGDGSLVSTSDFAGVVHVWDLRTGKTIQHFMGHAGRVLNASFHPNGFHLATGGDDGTIQIWDMRRRRASSMVSIPAHNNVTTSIQFAADGEYLLSASFDGTAKLWGCRKWNMLSELQGHQGKVTCAEILDGERGVVTCGFDKTLKLWS